MSEAVSGPRLRRARADDLPTIEALLAEERLPPQGLREHLGSFFVLEDDGRVVGSAGLELYGEAALLRSVVVTPEMRGRGLGERLTEAALAKAKKEGARRVYLFTFSAADFFARYGFRDLSVDDFDSAMADSFQVRAVTTIPQLRQFLRAMRLELPD